MKKFNINLEDTQFKEFYSSIDSLLDNYAVCFNQQTNEKLRAEITVDTKLTKVIYNFVITNGKNINLSLFTLESDPMNYRLHFKASYGGSKFSNFFRDINRLEEGIDNYIACDDVAEILQTLIAINEKYC